MITRTAKKTEQDVFQPKLYLAFELSNAQWKLGFTIGHRKRPRLRTIAAGDLMALQDEVCRAKERFRLSDDIPVVSCYEAGRDGFWLHRYLKSVGIMNLIIDSASIEVNRRAKRAKTDRMDVSKLLTLLIRYHSGEEEICSVVHVPSVEAEDNRQLHRELGALKTERTRHSNRIKGLLVSQGVRMDVGKGFLKQVQGTYLWDGTPLPPGMRARLEREHERLQLVNHHIQVLEKERKEIVQHCSQPEIEQVRQLMRLRGIGVNTAWLFVMEFFGWRDFRNRGEVGALSGLVPTPYQSGDQSREQGITKAGNRLVRSVAIEIAWAWLRYQPQSKLSRWYEERFAHGGKRLRKIGIVALARKLLISLWHYLEQGTPPDGAILKPI
jgi:transposase